MNTEHEVTGAQMCETRAPLSKKLASLELQVVDTVHGAANVATQTVDIIKDAVHETVAIVKETLDLRLQMERRPLGHPGRLDGARLRRGLPPVSARRDSARGKRVAPACTVRHPRIAEQQNGNVKDVDPESATEIAKLKGLANAWRRR